MLGDGSPREQFVADEALAHALPDDDEHFADLVGACADRASLVFVVGRHVASRGPPLAQGLHLNPRAGWEFSLAFIRRHTLAREMQCFFATCVRDIPERRSRMTCSRFTSSRDLRSAFLPASPGASLPGRAR